MPGVALALLLRDGSKPCWFFRTWRWTGVVHLGGRLFVANRS